MCPYDEDDVSETEQSNTEPGVGPALLQQLLLSYNQSFSSHIII